jgi:hypothetical protein
VKVNYLTIRARDRNNNRSNAFELNTAANTSIVAIVSIYNRREVTYSASSIIYITSINNLVINKWHISNRKGLVFS